MIEEPGQAALAAAIEKLKDEANAIERDESLESEYRLIALGRVRALSDVLALLAGVSGDTK